MNFNSYLFILFFIPVTFFGYFLITKYLPGKGGKFWLIIFSLTFYGWHNIKYLSLIFISIIFNFCIGSLISENNKPKVIFGKIFIISGIIGNISLLGYYKYSNFFIENINLFLNTQIKSLNLLFPLALSFITFTQIAYLVDCYRGQIKEHNFINYTLFITFFPKLISGPIVRYKEIMLQFDENIKPVFNYRNISIGLFIFFIGLSKKIFIADTLSVLVNNGFDIADKLNFIEAWVSSLAYTFQLYFDFSGYIDMATGVALLFNIKLPVNFNSPYKATSIQDFWRRWHITLSSFLRDYIYIPLGGNRHGVIRLYFNIMVVFFVCGIWHGSGWTFIVWGLLHGFASIVHRAWRQLGFRLNSILGGVITFIFINFAWVFFRAQNMDSAIKVLKGMVGLNGIQLPRMLSSNLSFLSKYGITFGETINNLGSKVHIIYFIPILLVTALFFINTNQFMERFKPNYFYAFIGSLITISSLISINKVNEFLYYNF